MLGLSPPLSPPACPDQSRRHRHGVAGTGRHAARVLRTRHDRRISGSPPFSTSVTGFMFPAAAVTPAHIVGGISLAVLAVAVGALSTCSSSAASGVRCTYRGRCRARPSTSSSGWCRPSRNSCRSPASRPRSPNRPSPSRRRSCCCSSSTPATGSQGLSSAGEGKTLGGAKRRGASLREQPEEKGGAVEQRSPRLSPRGHALLSTEGSKDYLPHFILITERGSSLSQNPKSIIKASSGSCRPARFGLDPGHHAAQALADFLDLVLVGRGGGWP